LRGLSNINQFYDYCQFSQVTVMITEQISHLNWIFY